MFLFQITLNDFALRQFLNSKNMGFPPLCLGKSVLSWETFAFFETTISFSGASNDSVHALAAASSEICTKQRCKKWMVSAILGRCAGTPSWTKCREKNYSNHYIQVGTILWYSYLVFWSLVSASHLGMWSVAWAFGVQVPGSVNLTLGEDN